jgi:hypothetical protein
MIGSEYERAPTREQMEDIMGNRVNVMNGRSEVGTSRRQQRGEAASNQGSKQASNQQSNKEAVGVNELSWREDEERLQSVAFFGEVRTERHHLANCVCSWC